MRPQADRRMDEPAEPARSDGPATRTQAKPRWDERARGRTRWNLAWTLPATCSGSLYLGRDAALPFVIGAAAIGAVTALIVLLCSGSRLLAWLGIILAIPIAYGVAVFPFVAIVGVGWTLQLLRSDQPLAGLAVPVLFGAGGTLAWLGAAWSELALHRFLDLRTDGLETDQDPAE